MLRLLHIENIAVIEQAEIVFEDGFNVMTGETGAGKSIVIDAISAILGERAYRDMIRTGTSRAAVRAIFDRVPELPWFAENGVPYDAETDIRRELTADGKNLCRVNGTAVTVGVLKKLGVQLINIHGQHDSAALFDEAQHLTVLDSFAEDEAERAAYAERYEAVRALRREIDRLSMDESEKLRRMESLQYQIDELTKAHLRPGEEEELEARRKLMQNAEKLSDGLHEASACLDGDSQTDGAATLLGQAERALARLARIDDQLAPLQETVADLMYRVRDCAEQVAEQVDALSFSEAELDDVEQRLDILHRLHRKYGPTCEEMLVYLEKAKNELDEIEFSSDRVEQLKKKLRAAEQTAQEAALVLRERRKRAGEQLSARICSELAELDMKKVEFSCVFTETELTPLGADAVAFYMTANAGEALKPLSKVASGGELARIMLALKNVLAERDRVPTLIFDEVDTGVSGRAAQRVAEKLLAVSRTKQVLCVTHLPQLAALADTHFRIAKREADGRTYTSVTPLDFEGRRQELARIIGGASITETTLQSAGEMLKQRQA
ncbi:MAG: DNA repair protein RecN [Candidatus Faecousia sp.]|uniref:DNA repair protein RecN n=1 Tax=Faecousia sp. TaxID=2952921 RepID=UPI002A8A4701|nr:DNA repair protein RecN [Candidatus Faecousia sp.]